MLALCVDVPAEKAVPHIAGVVEVRVRVAAPLRSQMSHGVGRGDEAGVCAQVEMEAFPERIDPVEKPRARQVITCTPPSPSVVQLVGERFSEVVHSERSDDFIR